MFRLLLGILTARGKNVGVYTDIVQNPTSYELENYNNTTGNCLLEKVEAQFDLLIHKIVTAVNDAFAPNVDADLTGVSGTDAKGNAMPALTNAKVLDANNCLVGADDDETIGTEVFTRKGQGSRYTVYTVNGPVTTTDENGNTITLKKKMLQRMVQRHTACMYTMKKMQMIKIHYIHYRIWK